jgi:hypothetical protein
VRSLTFQEKYRYDGLSYSLSESSSAGFTVQKWESFDVKVVEVKPDEEGNIIE